MVGIEVKDGVIEDIDGVQFGAGVEAQMALVSQLFELVLVVFNSFVGFRQGEAIVGAAESQ
jgi:hypothetical protein